MSEKDILHRYLDEAREALRWRLDGLSEYDVRRPLTPHGTNLLGLVKRLSGCEMGYFGAVFGRPFPDPPAWLSSDVPDADMWATPTSHGKASSISIGGPVLTPTRPSGHGISTRWARFRRGLPNAAGSRCTRSWST